LLTSPGTNIPIADRTSDLRIYFKNNEWRTLEYRDFRSVLGMTNEQANASLKKLMEEGTICKVAHGKWRYIVPKKQKATSVVSEIPAPAPVAPAPVERRPWPLDTESSRAHILYMLEDDIGKNGLLMTDFVEAIGHLFGVTAISGMINNLVWENKAYRRRHTSRPLSYRYFFGPDPDPASAPPMTKRIRAAERKSLTVPAVEPLPAPMPEPAPVQPVEPVSLAPVMSNQKSAYIASLRTRKAELEEMLMSILPLQEELAALDKILGMYPD